MAAASGESNAGSCGEAGDLREQLALALAECERLKADLCRVEQWASEFLDECGDAAFVFRSEDGRIVEANLLCTALLGFSREELLGMTVDELHPPDERGRVGELRARHAAAVRLIGVEGLHYRRKDGSLVPVSITGSHVLRENQQLAVVHVCDITAREQAEETLRRYAAELERSNRALQHFASVASHDLNEPLRKIQVFGDRLAATCGDALGDQGQDYLARMRSAAGRMRALIDGLLTYSRVTSRPNPFGSTDLAEVFRDVVADLEVRIDERRARIDVGVMPTLDADAVQMRQLFQNLLENALKFRRLDVAPTVEVRAERVDDHASSLGAWAITVCDNGIGFAPADRERIFDVLTRLHGRSEYDGVGIGLAVCRRIAERHGGSIRAEGALGEGATFTVILPARQPKVS